MKTILQIIPALGTGGAEQAVVDIAAALHKRGDRALIVSSGGRRVEEVERLGGLHITKPVNTKNPLKIIQHAFWLAYLIRQESVDLVHVRSRAPAWSAYLACQMTKRPFVTTFHAAYNFSCRIKKSYNRVMARGVRVIAISDYIADHIKSHYHLPDERVVVINRGIDVALYARAAVTEARRDALRVAWNLPHKEQMSVVLFPARLSPIKGHKLIIEAMALLKKEGTALPLLLFVGDDQGRTSYSQSLRDMIAKEGLEDHVRLVGPCADMAAAYSLADLVLTPSQVPEGFGRTPVEAMALGVPVIASNIGATKDTVLEGQTGWLLPPDEPLLWAAQIKAALAMDQDSRNTMVQRARMHVEQHFGLFQMVQKTLALYDELMKNKERTPEGGGPDEEPPLPRA
ncbi:MAG: glycosyltransferase family 4 protein [Bdellovibrionales bacterium]